MLRIRKNVGHGCLKDLQNYESIMIMAGRHLYLINTALMRGWKKWKWKNACGNIFEVRADPEYALAVRE